jgi:hypothetical protein
MPSSTDARPPRSTTGIATSAGARCCVADWKQQLGADQQERHRLEDRFDEVLERIEAVAVFWDIASRRP